MLEKVYAVNDITVLINYITQHREQTIKGHLYKAYSNAWKMITSSFVEETN